MLIKKYFEETYRSKTTCYITAIVGLIILAVRVATVQQPPLYDEPFYLRTLETLEQYGFSISFLKNIPTTGGPLYALVHNSLAPFTQLDVPGIRLVNVTLLGLTIITTSSIGYLIKLKSPILSALCMISIPMTWVLSGMALSEMPAIFLMSVGILFLLWTISNTRTQEDREEKDNKKTSFANTKQILALVIGGVAMGLAITGRQPLLVTLAAVPILGIDSRSRVKVLVFLLIASIIPLTLFWIWGGLTPTVVQTYMDQAGGGKQFSFQYLILSYCYAGGITLFLAPKFFSYQFKLIILIIILSVLINAIFGWIDFVPMTTLSNQFIPAFLLPIYTQISSGALFSLGVLYLASLFKNLIDNRNNLIYVFLAIATLFICFTTLKITVQFSSRYVAQALPLFILITEPYSEASYFKATRIVLGSLLGLAILTSYYFS